MKSGKILTSWIQFGIWRVFEVVLVSKENLNILDIPRVLKANSVSEWLLTYVEHFSIWKAFEYILVSEELLVLWSYFGIWRTFSTLNSNWCLESIL